MKSANMLGGLAVLVEDARLTDRERAWARELYAEGRRFDALEAEGRRIPRKRLDRWNDGFCELYLQLRRRGVEPPPVFLEDGVRP